MKNLFSLQDLDGEVWADVPEFEGYYKGSTMGRIKSVEKVLWNGFGHFTQKERILKGYVNVHGYRVLGLRKDGVHSKTPGFHQIIAMCFLNHKPCRFEWVINHINANKLDNRLANLEVCTQRYNTTDAAKRRETTSEFTGVCYRKDKNNWSAGIGYNWKMYNIGSFKNELDAKKRYEDALREIENGTFESFLAKMKIDRKLKYTSKYKGVSLHKMTGRWQSVAQINHKHTYIGLYDTELEAYTARCNYIESLNQQSKPDAA